MTRARHRITTWMAILGYGLVASGLPLPVGGALPAATADVAAKRLASKDRSQPFPCMDKPCGCATAEQCFTNCCCNTPSQTLAWARARGLEPALIAALARRAAHDPPAQAPASCCAPQAAQPSCCTAADDTCRDAVVCSADRSPVAEPTTMTGPAEPAGEEAPAAGCVVLRAMLACGGIVAQWCTSGAAPPPERIDMPSCRHCIDTLHIEDLAPACRADDLDVPPPRAA